jgi:hypothetical protein
VVINYILAFAGPVLLVVALIAMHIRVARDDQAARRASQTQPPR